MIRTDKGRELISAMQEAGAIEVRSAIDDDPDAVALLRKLSRVSRRRWPDEADAAPKRIPVLSA
jgi:coenzyme F420 hydrogenase subunit beta